jgi:CMP/dCMP kinase
MIITLSGKPGSGKSSIAKIIAQKLKYEFFSAGDYRGEIALKHNITIDQLNEIGKKEFWTDKEVDDKLKSLSKQNNLVVDGWLSCYFIKNSKKIFLDVKLNEAAKRIFKDQRPDEEKKETVKEVEKMLKNRLDQTKKRYKKYYHIDFTNEKYYDLIIDTTDLTKKQVIEKILSFCK